MKWKNKLAAAAITGAFAITGALIVPTQAQAMEDFFTSVDIENTPQGERVHVHHKGGRNYTGNLASSNKLHDEMWG